MPTSLLITLAFGLAAIVTAGPLVLWLLRVRARCAQLQLANATLARRQHEAELATRAKNRFVAGVTHELRTPLTAVIGFSELMRDGRAGPVNRTQREYLGAVRASADHLLELVGGVLDMASVEAGQIRLAPQPVEPSACAAECVAALRPLAAARGVALHYQREVLGTAALDPARLRQVIENFLSNAIKFTDAGGRVTVTLTRSDDRLLVCVADTGPGIAPADQRRIFDEFVRLGGRDGGGHGLGLAVTRQLVEAQGGGVAVRSAPGAGSTFTAWLPWASADADDASDAGPTVAPLRRPRPAPLTQPRPRRRVRSGRGPLVPGAAAGASRPATVRALRP